MYRIPMFFYNFIGTLWGFVPFSVYCAAKKNPRQMRALDAIDRFIINGCERWTPDNHVWREGPMFEKPSYYLGKLGL